ncbi:MAG: transposase [Betaproteobacteria bacterium]|nr:transposase [Betaproteobacteria bacterium]
MPTPISATRALVIDESGFAKKGEMSAGVARQWNGRLGKTDNSQVGVFAAVVRDRVAALVEGELYVPEEWFADPQRCREAGIPEGNVQTGTGMTIGQQI